MAKSSAQCLRSVREFPNAELLEEVSTVTTYLMCDTWLTGLEFTIHAFTGKPSLIKGNWIIFSCKCYKSLLQQCLNRFQQIVNECPNHEVECVMEKIRTKFTKVDPSYRNSTHLEMFLISKVLPKIPQEPWQAMKIMLDDLTRHEVPNVDNIHWSCILFSHRYW